MGGDNGAVTTACARPEIDRSDWWDRLWRPFWVLPAVVASGSTLLGLLLPRADERLAPYLPYLFESGPDGARQLLGTIASAMISVTGLVFSITMVVLQLASSQFTPRLLGQFLQSRVVQLTLGVFTGSFLFALTVLRLVRGDNGDLEEFVPQVSVAMAFLYVVVSVGLFIAFIQHITASVQLSQVLASLGARTREVITKLYAGERPAASWSPSAGETSRPVIHEGTHGHVVALDSSGLVAWAAEHESVVTLDVGMGSFVIEGQRLGSVWGDADPGDVDRFLHLAPERALGGDFGFGVRQLTDIAERALSPGVNDPTTAVNVLDELHVVLRPLALERDLSPYLVDEEGVVRATYRPTSFADCLDASLAEIAHYAADSPRVLARIRDIAVDLQAVAVPQHQGALEALVDRLDRHAADSAEAPARS